jgi:hypothetical protein
MTKSHQVAQLLLRQEGCTYSDALAITGWRSISLQWHTKNNGLRLQVKKTPGEPNRYFGFRPQIQIRIREQRPSPRKCFASDCDQYGRNVVRCQQCGHGLVIYANHLSRRQRSWLREHARHHARIRRRFKLKEQMT